jgi:hypothetical protein
MNGRVRRGRVASVVVAAVAAVAAVAIAVPSNALAFDHHFSLISKDTSGHGTSNGFSFRFDLLNTHDDRDYVGHGHGKCRADQGRKAKCKVKVHLDGAVGGAGDLLVKGNFGRGDHTLNVVDGNGAFGGGIAGKVRVTSISNRLDLLSFALTR